MDMMRQSGVDFTTQFKLQFLCIDNDQVRSRVLANKSMDINLIPCILIVYSSGGVEKYEASHAFKWVEEMISRFNPPPPPVVQQAPASRKPIEYEYDEDEDEIEDYESPRRPKKQERKREKKVKRHMKPIQSQEADNSTVTSIDDIPLEDDQVNTMVQHQNRMGQPVRPQARVRRDRGNYEDEDIEFGGPPPETARQPPGGAVKNKIQPTKANDATDVMAKAAAFAKMRDQDNETMRPAGPQIQNRP